MKYSEPTTLLVSDLLSQDQELQPSRLAKPYNHRLTICSGMGD